MKRLFTTFAVLFIAIITFAQTVLPSDTAVKMGKLENGLTYYIRRNVQPAQRAEFYLATNVGAFQETDDQDGLAHFLEHMCFNGTKHFPGKGILEYLQSIGAEFGRNINASTGFEQTNYMLNNIPVTREGVIDTCLMIMRDYSHYVTCDPKEIDAERGVILEERRSRRNAQWRMFEKALPFYYGDTHMSRRTLIGGEEQLKTFKYESLTNFYRTWYNPDMQAVVVVGDVDVAKVEQKIKDIFGSIPAPAQPTVKPIIPIPDNDTPKVGIITDAEASYSSIEILWRIEPTPMQYRATDANLVNEILKDIVRLVMMERFGDITSTPEAPFLQASLSIGSLCNSSDAVFGTVMFKDGESLPAFKAFMLEVEKLKRYGFTEGEIERAKTKIIGALEKSAAAADSRKNDELVPPILNSFFHGVYNLDPATELQLTQLVLTQLSAQLPMVIKAMMPQLIGEKNCVIISNAPERDGLVQPTEEQLLQILADVKNAEIAPNVEETSDEPLLDAALLKGAKSSQAKAGTHGSSTWTLSNGVKVVVLKTDYKKDQIMLDLAMDGGRTLIKDDELYSFDENIMALYGQNRGVAGFSGTQLKKMLAGKNVKCSPYISTLRHGISAETTPKDLETAMQLLYLNMASPRFDDNEYRIGITQLNAMLPNLEKQPMFKFQTTLKKVLYGDNPRQFVISPDVVAKANISTYEKVYRRLFDGVNGATLYVVGNVDADLIRPLVEKYIGSIEKGGKATQWKDRGENFVKGRIVEGISMDMETPKSTVFQFYWTEVPYSVKNEVMLDACKQVLDMVFTETLRESEGGTYGAGVSSMCLKDPKGIAAMQVVFETNPESAERLAKMANEGVLNLVKNGIPEDKMNMIVKNFNKNVPENRIKNSYWMNVLKYDKYLGVDYDKEYEAAVSLLNSENIIAALKAILDGGNFIEIVMSPTK